MLGGNSLGATQSGYLTSITTGTASASKALVLDSSTNISGINSVGTTTLVLGGNSLGATQSAYLTSITAGTASASKALVLDSSTNIAGINSVGTTTLVLGGNSLGATQSGYLTSITAGTVTASKVLVVDSNKDLSSIRNLTLTGSLGGVTTLGSSGAFTNTLSTASTSNSTGALILSGGIGISNSTDASSSSNGGTITTAGGAAIAKSLYVGTMIVVGGTAVSASAWGASGIQSRYASANYTDNSTAGSGTASLSTFNSFAQPTLLASNTGVTTTTAATIYIANAPAAGTNMTITNAYALYVAAGKSLMAGNCFLGTGTAGGVCIGTSTDTARLLSCLNSSQSTGTRSFLTFGQDNTASNQAELSFYYAGSGSSSNRIDLGFFGSVPMSILASGKIGMNGQTAPAYLLDFGQTAHNVHVSVFSDSGGTYGFGANNSSFQMFSGTNFHWYTVNTGPVTDTNSTRGTNIMALTSAGNLTTSGSMNATAFNLTSDRRVKENIRNITTDEAANFVRNIDPVFYKLKQRDDYCYGYIAQDLLKNNAELLVQTQIRPIDETIDDDGFVSPKDTIYTIAGWTVSCLIHKYVKMMDDRVIQLETHRDELAQKNADQSQKIDDLEARLAKLEALLLQ